MEFDLTQLGTKVTKLLNATIVPRPVALVITRDTDGRVNAAPYSWFNVMSTSPPVVCFGIAGRAAGDAKDTGNILRRTGEFVVNMVPYKLAEAMNITAIDFDASVEELVEARLTTVPSTRIQPPRVAESPVAFECERLVTLELGNESAVVLGRVLTVHIDEAVLIDPTKYYVDTPALDLVGRMHGGGWYTRSNDLFELPHLYPEDWLKLKQAAE